MSLPPHHPRDIPVLTDAVESSGTACAQQNLQAAQLAIVAQTLKLADALIHQAAKDMEAILFERVYDRLKVQLPELVDKILSEQLGLPAADKS